ncbi:MAG: hypothetical protein IT338_17520 [Thermomicrobiales bacterium]|nr:hypothetical protein [Thermomicrobiales bacterium]
MHKAFLFCDGIDPATKQACDQQVEAPALCGAELPEGWWAAKLPEVHGVTAGGRLRKAIAPLWASLSEMLKANGQERQRAIALVDELMTKIGHADDECDKLRADLQVVRDVLKKGNVEDGAVMDAVSVLLMKTDEPETPTFETYHFCARHPQPNVALAEDIPGAVGGPDAPDPA